MRPIFRNPAILNHQNPIRRANRRQSMRNDEARPPRQHLLNRVLNQLFRLRIDRGRGFVQHENRRVRQNRAGKGNQLLLTGGEAVAALADVRLIAILHVADEGFRADHAGGFRHFLVGGIGAAVADVIRNRAGEKVRRLQDVAEVGLKPQLTARAVIRAVDEDFALRRLIEAADEVDDRGFAAAGFANERDGLPRLYRKRHVSYSPMCSGCFDGNRQGQWSARAGCAG